MAIPDTYRSNFETLCRAAKSGDLALVECADSVTGQPRYVVCAVGRSREGEFIMTPFGHLDDGNPYEAYLPPTS